MTMTLTDKADFIPYLLICVVFSITVLYSSWKRASVGLGLSYIFQLWLLYGGAACMHALPWSDLPDTPHVFTGFVISAYGLISFVVGWILQPHLFAAKRPAPKTQSAKLAGMYVIAGCIFYFVISPLAGAVPSATSICAGGQQLVIVGLCLGSWIAWHKSGWRGMVRWCVPALLYPVVTVARQGFLGYGIIALATVAMFCATLARPRWVVMATFLIAAYGGLSLYVAYMQERNEIRAAVWGGKDLSARLSRIQDTIDTIEPFDIHNQKHLEAYDERLNQATFVGLAAENLSHSGEFAHGGTLIQALYALIPRAIWPDKPITAGSGGLVSRYTGLEFAAGTSVGVGPVLELYVNFGISSVILGFACLGMILSYADAKASAYLNSGDWQQFAMWFLFGIGFLQVSGSFVELTVSAVASIVVAQMVNAMLASYAFVRGHKAPPVAGGVPV